jgi:hypothetical protein
MLKNILHFGIRRFKLLLTLLKISFLKKTVQNVLIENEKNKDIFKKYDEIRNNLYQDFHYKIYQNSSLPEILGEMYPIESYDNNVDDYKNPVLLFFQSLLPWNN